MLLDFRRKGVTTPTYIMNNLKSAKTLISVLDADPSCLLTTQKIEELLRSVESYLFSEGTKQLGEKYVDAWIKRLDDANKEASEKVKTAVVLKGIPRNSKWIRIKAFEDFPLEKLKDLASKLNLSYNVQDEDSLLIYGSDENLKKLIGNIRKTQEKNPE
jgi:hypothetical protein